MWYSSHLQRLIQRFLPFLSLLSFALAVWIGNPTLALTPQPRPEIRGVWITSNDTKMLRDRLKVGEAMSQLRQLNFNTVYPVVWNSGYVMYPSAVAKQAGIQPFVYTGSDGQDILDDVIGQAHRQGLLVLPWFEFGFMTPPTSELALIHPDWLTQQRDGSQTSIGGDGEVAWLNPFHPEVQRFITDLIVEIVTQYDIDGIQFDDHMSLPSEFGYDKYTIALYAKETKKSPPDDFQNPAWVRWRANKITAFIKQLRQTVKVKKAKAIFSISPNYYNFAYKLQLQDWLTWVRQNIADELIVQVYRPSLEAFIELVDLPEIKEAQKKIPTGVGILTGLRNNSVAMSQIQSQVRAAQERGLGVSFFYYESLWDYAPESIKERQAGFQALFSSPISRFTNE